MAGRLAGDVVLPHQVIARFEVVGVTLDVEKAALEALEPKLVFSILLEKVGTHLRSAAGRVPGSYCQKLCMGLSCGGAILAFSIHEFDASNDLGELI